jgi:hypothetical protein
MTSVAVGKWMRSTRGCYESLARLRGLILFDCLGTRLQERTYGSHAIC